MEINKCKKLACNLYDKKDYVVHIRALKQALLHDLKLKKVQKVLKFNQKPYIDMNILLRKLAKNAFEKEFFKLMINAVFAKTYGERKKT